MKAEVVVGSVVGVVVGVVATRMSTSLVQQAFELLHREEVEAAEKNGYQKGWREASDSPMNIRRRYREMFETDKEEGQAFKA